MLIQTPRTKSHARHAPFLQNGTVQRAPLNTVENKYLAANTNKSTFVQPLVKRERARLLKKIISSAHYDPIASICKKKHYTLSIRETGLLSVKRIRQGAKAKPHSILEKTIKKSSIEKIYGKEKGSQILYQAKDLDIDGFVGHWDNNQLKGLRADNPSQKVKPYTKTTSEGIEYIPIDLTENDGGPLLAKLKKLPGWQKHLYTGDYDLHEAYRNNHQIAEATREKVDLLNNLNKSIANSGVDVVNRKGSFVLANNQIIKKGNTDYAMFQHGDQATYRMNQLLEHGKSHGKAKLVKAVAEESDEPMAWCKNGYWFVTKNKKEHAELRKVWGLTAPHTWQQSEINKIMNNEARTVEYL